MLVLSIAHLSMYLRNEALYLQVYILEAGVMTVRFSRMHHAVAARYPLLAERARSELASERYPWNISWVGTAVVRCGGHD